MSRHATTSWEVIEGAADGDERQRAEFVQRYSPLVREYLSARWQGSPLLGSIEDTLNDVFVESFRSGGVLERADRARAGGFRAFFYGVIRNVARRVEDARARLREQQPSTSFDADDREVAATSLSRVFDRAWARSVLDEAGARYREQAQAEDESARRRVELLRLRFEDELPIREIAKRWQIEAEKLHQEYRRARREFRRCLTDVLAMHEGRADDVDLQWAEFLSLLR